MCDTALKLGRAAAPEKATVLLAFPLFYNGAIDSDLIMVEEYSSSSLFLTLADLFWETIFPLKPLFQVVIKCNSVLLVVKQQWNNTPGV